VALYLLDTSVIIDVLRNKRERPALLRRLLEQDHILACCPINISEVYAGMRPGEERGTTQFLESLEFLPTTRDTARSAGLMKRDFAAQGKSLSLADTMIAAVATANGCTLITDNIKDFPSPALQLYKP